MFWRFNFISQTVIFAAVDGLTPFLSSAMAQLQLLSHYFSRTVVTMMFLLEVI